MRRFTVSVLSLSLLAAVACSDDDTSDSKGVVDEETLNTDGVTVTLNGNVGTVDVPFIVRVPNGDDADLSMELESAASLTVRSDMTGTTANLSDGTMIEADATPSAAGEYKWAVSEDRLSLTFTFYNETPAGTTLKTDRTYTATMQVTDNAYVENVASTSVAVSVN